MTRIRSRNRKSIFPSLPKLHHNVSLFGCISIASGIVTPGSCSAQCIVSSEQNVHFFSDRKEQKIWGNFCHRNENTFSTGFVAFGHYHPPGKATQCSQPSVLRSWSVGLAKNVLHSWH